MDGIFPWMGLGLSTNLDPGELPNPYLEARAGLTGVEGSYCGGSNALARKRSWLL